MLLTDSTCGGAGSGESGVIPLRTDGVEWKDRRGRTVDERFWGFILAYPVVVYVLTALASAGTEVEGAGDAERCWRERKAE